jgi:hypothetical protein
MIGPVIEGFRMRHQAEHPPGGIADSGYILQGTVGVFRIIASCGLSSFVGIPKHHLVILKQPPDSRLLRVKFALPMTNGKFQHFQATSENTGRVAVDFEMYPPILKITAVVSDQGDLSCLVVSVEAGKQP